MRQYLRACRLRIGSVGMLEKEYLGFRVTFKVEKNLESNPNTAAISIYNLSDTSRARIEMKDAICSLDVGYGDEFEQIFFGTIAKAFTKKVGPDLITEIECGDGEKAYQQAKIDLSFPPGATMQQVLDKVTASMREVVGGGVTSVKSFLLNQFKSFGTGAVFSGSAKDTLDSLTKSVGLEWSIQDGEIQFLETNAGTQEEQFVVNPSTGLIGSPGKIKAAAASGDTNGITFDMLLQPKLRPGRLIQIEAANVNGIFRVTKISHEGDNFGGTWLSKCEGYLPQ